MLQTCVPMLSWKPGSGCRRKDQDQRRSWRVSLMLQNWLHHPKLVPFLVDYASFVNLIWVNKIPFLYCGPLVKYLHSVAHLIIFLEKLIPASVSVFVWWICLWIHIYVLVHCAFVLLEVGSCVDIGGMCSAMRVGEDVVTGWWVLSKQLYVDMYPRS